MGAVAVVVVPAVAATHSLEVALKPLTTEPTSAPLLVVLSGPSCWWPSSQVLLGTSLLALEPSPPLLPQMLQPLRRVCLTSLALLQVIQWPVKCLDHLHN